MPMRPQAHTVSDNLNDGDWAGIPFRAKLGFTQLSMRRDNLLVTKTYRFFKVVDKN